MIFCWWELFQSHYFSGVNIFHCFVAIPPECLKQFQGIHQSWFSWIENVFLISWYFLDILGNFRKVLIFCRFLVQKQRNIKLHSSLWMNSFLLLASHFLCCLFYSLSLSGVYSSIHFLNYCSIDIFICLFSRRACFPLN